MFDETITFDPLGTITVEFDDRKWVVRRVKLKHLRHFRRLLQTIRDDAQAKLKELSEAAESATGKGKVKADAELRAYAETPFYEDRLDWIRQVFEQLSDPLPDDTDEWPAWLATDPNLPGRFLNHWQTSPKASGENPS